MEEDLGIPVLSTERKKPKKKQREAAAGHADSAAVRDSPVPHAAAGQPEAKPRKKMKRQPKRLGDPSVSAERGPPHAEEAAAAAAGPAGRAPRDGAAARPRTGSGREQSTAPSAEATARMHVPAPADALQAERRQLPIFQAREEILRALGTHDTLVLVGETGSGKTTQLPQFLHAAGYARRGMIAVTQPRRVAATSVAARVALEMGCSLGELVGYAVRFDDKSGPGTRVKFMTDGMLLRELMLDARLSKYAVVVLDEAHERTLNTELLLALIKRLQATRAKGNRPIKVVVMSATLEAEAYANFFPNPTVLRVPGRRFPVQVYYTPEPQPDTLDAAVAAVLQIHVEEAPGDILVFLTGQDDIDDAVKVIRERSRALPPSAAKLLPCPLYAALPPAEQQAAFAPAPDGARKVVVATNIAESSITIEGVRFVVDSGLVKARIFDPKSNIDHLDNIPVSQAQCRQRTGRAGRVAAGTAFNPNRSPPKPTPEALDPTPTPRTLNPKPYP